MNGEGVPPYPILVIEQVPEQDMVAEPDVFEYPFKNSDCADVVVFI